MGRKPNPLIAEFFERGEKLENSSNRYEHTCKICHEHFPKGRIDALTTHLLKSCTALPADDRQRVLESFSSTPNQNGTFNQLAVAMRQQQTGDLSFLPQSDTSTPAIETIINTSGQQFGDPFNGRKRKRGAPTAQQRYENEFQLQRTQFQDDASRRYMAVNTNGDSTHEQILRGIQQFNENQDSPADSLVDPTISSELPDFSQQLALAASAASNMISQDQDDEYIEASQIDNMQPQIEQTVPEPHPPVLDPQLQGQQPIMQHHPARRQPRDFIFQHVKPGKVRGVPDAAYIHGFRLQVDSKKQRPRGRFSDDRRKEVQEVRKHGACIRCRMLKKPCSGDDPCSTCASTITARLWNHPCMRARIADEFDLLRDNIHLLVAIGEVDLVRRLAPGQVQTGYTIEATHVPDAAVNPMVFPGCRARVKDVSSLDVIMQRSQLEKPGIEIDFLDLDHSYINDIVVSYFDRAGQYYCDNEPSNVMHETLLMAQETCAQTEDKLLSDATRLWGVVQALSDSSDAWQIKSAWDSDNPEQTPLRDDTLGHRLITHQIRAFAEKHAFQLCKSLMNDFEKRLIQRQRVQKQQFETFLAAVILMNCLEKICWIFSVWVNDWDHQTYEQTGENSQRRLAAPIERGAWPMGTPPHDYLARGDRVADIIAMLMKMRDIPPPMAVAPDGFLLADLHRKQINQSRYGSSGYLMTGKASGSDGKGQEPELNQFGTNTEQTEHSDEEGIAIDETDQPGDTALPQVVNYVGRRPDLDSLQEGGSIANVAELALQELRSPKTDNEGNTIIRPSEAEITSPDQRLKERHSNTTTTMPPITNDQEQGANNDTQQNSPLPPDISPPLPEDNNGDDDDFMAHLRAAAADVAGSMHRPPAEDSDVDTAMPGPGATYIGAGANAHGVPFADMGGEGSGRAIQSRDEASEPLEASARTKPPIEVWFERVRLNVDVLQNARVQPRWSADDSRCWELKFVSRMLLPENPR